MGSRLRVFMILFRFPTITAIFIISGYIKNKSQKELSLWEDEA